jgi:hypothetical protein
VGAPPALIGVGERLYAEATFVYIRAIFAAKLWRQTGDCRVLDGTGRTAVLCERCSTRANGIFAANDGGAGEGS